MRVAVVSDSGSGITLEQGKNTGIYVLPLQISVNGKTEFEGETLFVEEVYELVKRGDDVQASQPSLERIKALFNEIKESYDSIFAIPVCRGLSETIDSMKKIAEEIDIPFDYVDCYSSFSNQLYLAQMAKLLLEDGKSVAEVKERLLSSVQDSITMILPKNMKQLVKGGRVTQTVTALGSLLKITPILYLNSETGGKIDFLLKRRTNHKAMEECIKELKKRNITEDYLLTVGHVDNEDMGKEFLTMLRNAFPKNEILYHSFTSVIGIHAGIGCIGLQCIKRVEMD